MRIIAQRIIDDPHVGVLDKLGHQVERSHGVDLEAFRQSPHGLAEEVAAVQGGFELQ